MRITDVSLSLQEESWANDPNAFVADEDDEMVGCNVRISGIDFITVRQSSQSSRFVLTVLYVIGAGRYVRGDCAACAAECIPDSCYRRRER